MSDKQLQIGTQPSQHHDVADGLGHLLLFSRDELEKHAQRIHDILVNRGVTVECIDEQDGNNEWKKLFLQGLDGSVPLLFELYDINRALAISNILGAEIFQNTRNGVLLQDQLIQIGDSQRTYGVLLSTLQQELTEESKNIFIGAILAVGAIAGKMKLPTEGIDEAIKELKEYSFSEVEEIPQKFSIVISRLFESLSTQYEKEGYMLDGKNHLMSVINSINNSPEEFQKYIQMLEVSIPENEMQRYRKFLKPTYSEEMYGKEGAKNATEAGIDRIFKHPEINSVLIIQAEKDPVTI